MRWLLVSMLCCSLTCLSAQMSVSPGDTLYGNEWVEPGGNYLRIEVAETGWYRLTEAALTGAGFSLGSTPADRWELYYRGASVPLRVAGDGIYFYGRTNDGGLDRYLFERPDAEQLNPTHSIFTDTTAYFLRTSPAANPLIFSHLPGEDGSGLPAVTGLSRRHVEDFGQFPNKYIQRIAGVSVYYSHYDRCEGHGSRRENDLLSPNGTTVTTARVPLPGYPGSGSVDFSLRFGVGFDNHQQALTVNGNPIRQFTTDEWRVIQLDTSIELTGNDFDFTLTGTAGDRDKASLAFLDVTYPATAVISDDEWMARSPAGPAQQLPLSGLTPTGTYELCDVGNGYCRSFVADNDGSYDLALPAVNADRQLYLRKIGTERISAVMRPFTATPLPEGDYDYLIVSSRRLNAGGAVDRYAAYRRSPAGGGLRVGVAYVEDLYDQFGYGLTNSPLAVKNFIFHQLRQSPSLRYLLIVGKGIEIRSNRSPAQRARNQAVDFVPPFGYPAQDFLLSAPLGKVVHRLATGRIAVHNEAEIDVYLDKVREMDAQVNLPQTFADRGWTKRFMQLGGGTSPFERSSIRRNLESMEQIVVSSQMEATTTAFYKSSSDPTETAGSDEIFRRINEGVIALTFSGHSSPDVFDFNIDLPDNYDNAGRLPSFFSLGCYSGNMYRTDHGVGERFILLPERGAITFAASRGLGFINALGRIGDHLYDEISSGSYGKPIGEIIQAVAARYEGNDNFSHRSLIEQFSLQGDPAYRMQPAPGPDLVIDPASVQFATGAVSLQADSFSVDFTVYNLGTEPGEDEITVKIEQELPDGSRYLHDVFPFTPTGFATPLQFTLANQGPASTGFNRLHLTVDAVNQVEEFPRPAAEDNNLLRSAGGEAGIPFYVVANTAYPLFPYDYALVSPEEDNRLVLTAATSDPLSDERTYRLQLSLDPDYANPIAETEVSQIGGRIRWEPSINWQDGTVYYWRVSPDSSFTDGAGLVWRGASFTFLDNEINGFGQSDAGQYAEGKLVQLVVQADGEVVPTADTIYITMDNEAWYVPGENTGYLYNSASIYSWEMRPWLVQRTGGVAVAVFEGYSGSPWLNNGSVITEAYGWPTSRPRDEYWFWSADDLDSRANLIEFLEEVVPEGSIVMFWTVIFRAEDSFQAEEWAQDSSVLGRNLFSYLEEQGAEQIRGLETADNAPYIFLYRKGVAPLAEEIGSSPDDRVSVTYGLPGRDPGGTLISEAMGPATDWSGLSWSLSGPEEEADVNRLVLYGGRDRTTADSLINFETPGSYNLEISAEDYPFLSFVWHTEDDRRKTLRQLKNVRLSGTFLPDLLFDANGLLVTSSDTLQEGQDIRLRIAVANAGPVSSGSARVTARWFDTQNTLIDSSSVTIAALAPNDTAILQFILPTGVATNAEQLRLVINPDREVAEYDYTNNSLQRGFSFRKDAIDPLLDVTFDGRRIRAGELVSSSPAIVVELRDENPFLLLDNPSAVRIEIRDPEGQPFVYGPDHPDLTFYPAEAGGDNLARYELRPTLTIDGTYLLSITGEDATDNPAGRVAYETDFEIVRAQSITRVVNYPNPFSDRTHFVYELTGSTPLADYRLDIMTVSGEVVRSLGPAELGPLRVGRHQTDESWDGTDRYGDQLANGVYLYRFVTRSEAGADGVTHRSSGLDAFFTNNTGKLVILR